VTQPDRASWEATNALTVASTVVAAAAARTESRGCHRRTDFSARRDVWRRHIGARLTATGDVEVRG
jgi:L-aspartate oxidase